MRETKLLGILTNLRGEIQKMGWNAYAEENCVTKRESKTLNNGLRSANCMALHVPDCSALNKRRAK